jgi:hypothetical protein
LTRWRSIIPLALSLASAAAISASQASTAQAQTDETRSKASAMAREAKESFDLGDYATALSLYQRAESIHHETASLLGVARSQARLGKLPEALATYDRVLKENPSPGSKPLLAAAEKERAELAARLPRLTLVLKGNADGAVSLDGVVVPPGELGQPRVVSAGSHTIEVAEGKNNKAFRVTIEAAEGKTTEVPLTPEIKPALPPPPADRDGDKIPDPRDACPDAAGPPSDDPKKNGCPPPPDLDSDGIPDTEDACPRKAGVRSDDPDTNGCPAAVQAPPPPPPGPPPAENSGDKGPSVLPKVASVMFVVGGFSLLTGAATGGYTVVQNQNFKDKCPNQRCPSSETDSVSTYNTLRTVSTATLIGGGALLFVGSIVHVLAPKPPVDGALFTPSVRIAVGPASLGLQGAF